MTIQTKTAIVFSEKVELVQAAISWLKSYNIINNSDIIISELFSQEFLNKYLEIVVGSDYRIAFSEDENTYCIENKHGESDVVYVQHYNNRANSNSISEPKGAVEVKSIRSCTESTFLSSDQTRQIVLNNKGIPIELFLDILWLDLELPNLVQRFMTLIDVDVLRAWTNPSSKGDNMKNDDEQITKLVNQKLTSFNKTTTLKDSGNTKQKQEKDGEDVQSSKNESSIFSYKFWSQSEAKKVKHALNDGNTSRSFTGLFKKEHVSPKKIASPIVSSPEFFKEAVDILKLNGIYSPSEVKTPLSPTCIPKSVDKMSIFQLQIALQQIYVWICVLISFAISSKRTGWANSQMMYIPLAEQKVIFKWCMLEAGYDGSEFKDSEGWSSVLNDIKIQGYTLKELQFSHISKNDSPDIFKEGGFLSIVSGKANEILGKKTNEENNDNLQGRELNYSFGKLPNEFQLKLQQDLEAKLKEKEKALTIQIRNQIEREIYEEQKVDVTNLKEELRKDLRSIVEKELIVKYESKLKEKVSVMKKELSVPAGHNQENISVVDDNKNVKGKFEELSTEVADNDGNRDNKGAVSKNIKELVDVKRKLEEKLNAEKFKVSDLENANSYLRAQLKSTIEDNQSLASDKLNEGDETVHGIDVISSLERGAQNNKEIESLKTKHLALILELEERNIDVTRLTKENEQLNIELNKANNMIAKEIDTNEEYKEKLSMFNLCMEKMVNIETENQEFIAVLGNCKKKADMILNELAIDGKKNDNVDDIHETILVEIKILVNKLKNANEEVVKLGVNLKELKNSYKNNSNELHGYVSKISEINHQAKILLEKLHLPEEADMELCSAFNKINEKVYEILQKNKEYDSHCVELDTKLKHKENKIKELETTLTEEVSFRKALESASVELFGTENVKQNLISKVKELFERHKLICEELLNCEEIKNQIEIQFKQKLQDFDELKLEILDYERKCNESMAKNNALEEKNQLTESEIQCFKETNIELNELVQKLNGEINKSNQKLAGVENEKEKLEGEINESKELICRYESEIEKLEHMKQINQPEVEKFELVMERYDLIENERRKLQDQLHKCQRQNAILEEYKRKAEKEESRSIAIKQQLDDLEKTVQQQRDTYEYRISELKRKQAQSSDSRVGAGNIGNNIEGDILIRVIQKLRE